MLVNEWWIRLNKELEQFCVQNPDFAKIKDGQFSIIKEAASIGITMSAGSILYGLSDKSKGERIASILLRLGKDSLPRLDSVHADASRQLVTIYLEHLRRYQSVHEKFSPTIKTFASGAGKDLDKIAEEVRGKDIPKLESALSPSSVSMEIKQESKQEIKQVTPVGSLTITNTQTTTMSVSFSSFAPPEPPKLGMDFSTASLQEIASYARLNIQSTLDYLLPFKAQFDSNLKKKMEILTSVNGKQSKDSKITTELEKLNHDLEMSDSLIKKLKLQITHYDQLKQLASNASATRQDVCDLVVKQCSPLLIEEAIEGIKDYEKLDDDIQIGIQKSLAEKLKQPDWVRRILAEYEVNYGLIVNSLITEMNAALEHISDSKSFSKELTPIQTVFFNRVGIIIQKIVAEVPDYKELDDKSRLAVAAVLRTVLSSPSCSQKVMYEREDSTIVANIVAKSAALVRDAFYLKTIRGKGIYVEGCGGTAMCVGQLFKQPVKPLTAAILEKALLTVQIAATPVPHL